MVFIDWFGRSRSAAQIVRAAAEGAVLAAVFAVAVGFAFSNPDFVSAARFGIFAAWLASTVSVAWLLWARAKSTEAFWWAFGGGMALRAGVLGVLAAIGVHRGMPLEAVLVSYVFALLAMLLTLELRHFKL